MRLKVKMRHFKEMMPFQRYFKKFIHYQPHRGESNSQVSITIPLKIAKTVPSYQRVALEVQILMPVAFH